MTLNPVAPEALEDGAPSRAAEGAENKGPVKVEMWIVDHNPCGASYDSQGRLKHDPRPYADVYIKINDKEERIPFDTNKVKEIKKQLKKILKEKYGINVKQWKREFYEKWGNTQIFCARAGRHIIYTIKY